MKLYALYEQDGDHGYFITLDPATWKYSQCERMEELQLWDVWEEDMIPYVLEEKGVKTTYEIKEIGENLKKRLSFELLD